MAQILGTPMPNLPKINFQINWILLLAIFIIVVVICIVIYLVWNMRTYNRKIVLFENIAGLGYHPTFRDKARVVKVGDGGEELLFLKKKKVYRTAYGRKMGKNTYYFAVGQDGFWYNFILGDLDAKLNTLDIEPIDRDLRYMHVAVRKNIAERYRKINFMEKYGTILMSGIFILIMIIGLGILINKMGDIAQTINIGIEQSNKVIATASDMIGKLNNLNTGSSGVIPAGVG
jgi:hypothetical protein